MKTQFFTLLLGVLFLACTKKDTPLPTGADTTDPNINVPVHLPIITLGQGAALKDGEPWNLDYEATYYKSDTTVRLRGQRYLGSVLESFLVVDVPLRKGKYPIEYYFVSTLMNQSPNAAVGYVVDGDQGAGSFFIDTTRQDHFLEVLHVDKAAKTIEGRFQMFMRRHPVGINALSLPDSMAITQGKFHLEVKQP